MSDPNRVFSHAYSSPADRTAARVIRGGTEFVAALEGNQSAVWIEKPPTFPLPRHYRDLSGIAIDRLVVVGYVGKTYRGGRASGKRWWVCRCNCGRYCCLRDETIFKGEDRRNKEPLMCNECNHLYWNLQRRSGSPHDSK